MRKQKTGVIKNRTCYLLQLSGLIDEMLC